MKIEFILALVLGDLVIVTSVITCSHRSLGALRN